MNHLEIHQALRRISARYLVEARSILYRSEPSWETTDRAFAALHRARFRWHDIGERLRAAGLEASREDISAYWYSYSGRDGDYVEVRRDRRTNHGLVSHRFIHRDLRDEFLEVLAIIDRLDQEENERQRQKRESGQLEREAFTKRCVEVLTARNVAATHQEHRDGHRLVFESKADLERLLRILNREEH